MTPAICKFSKAVIALALGFVVTSTYPTKSKADTRKIVPTPQFAAALGTDVKTFISKPGMKFRKQLSSKWCPRKTCEWYRAKKRGSVNSQITVYARHGKIFSMSLRFSSWTKRNAEKALAKVSQFTNPGEVPPYIAKSSKSVRGEGYRLSRMVDMRQLVRDRSHDVRKRSQSAQIQNPSGERSMNRRTDRRIWR